MIRKLSEHLFRISCDADGCSREIVCRAGNSWGAYRQLTESGWGIDAKDLCWDCVTSTPAPTRKKRANA